MEKFGVQEDDLISGLRDEEHDLMLIVSKHMSSGEKTAAEERDFQRTQNRLQNVRDKITDHDMKKMGNPG